MPIFAFLTGFVCAYKPLKLAYQQGNAPASLKSVARSAFRRPPRLILPALAATFISFVLSCLGGYKTSNRVDSLWVRFDAPDPLPFGENLRRFFRSCLTTWTDTENVYDRHQWAMRPLLIGAFQVYGVLAATVGMRFKYRVLVHVLLILYWLMNVNPLTGASSLPAWRMDCDFSCPLTSETETFGAMFALGTLLAELAQHRPTQDFITSHQRLLTFVITPILLLIGGYIGSYPQENADWTPWSQRLHQFLVDPAGDESRGSLLVPKGSDVHRRASAFFIMCTAVSIFISPLLQKLLSHRVLIWLGHHSFAVYLLHGTILRTVCIWIIYGITGEPWTPAGTNEDGTKQEQEWLHPKSGFHEFIGIVVFIALTYTAAWAWMKWVDTACARATQWLENKVFDDEEGESKPSLAEKGYAHLDGTGNGTSPRLHEAGN